MPTYLILDGSYYCFYRFHALKQWWKHARAGKDIEDHLDEFLLKFRNHFVSKLLALPKSLGLTDVQFIVGKDCPRKDIWRMELFPNYKGNRNYDDQPVLKAAFGKVYTEDLFLEGGADQILYHPRLEADDVIALFTKKLPPDADIHIVTSDTDYLQLMKNNITIHTLKGGLLTDTKGYQGDPDKYLFCKCVSGDKSDNIPSAFPKCGPKTAEKCWDCPEFFEEKLKDPEVKKQYELNKILISFEHIPLDFASQNQVS